MSDEEDYSSSDDDDYVPSGENFMFIHCVKYFTWHFVSHIGFICSFLHGITKHGERERECVCVFMKEYDTYVVLVQIKLPGLVQSLDWSE